MKAGTRGLFRNLTIIRRDHYSQANKRTGGEYTVHMYEFRGEDGAKYVYNGSNYRLGLLGDTIDIQATVLAYRGDNEPICYLGRPFRVHDFEGQEGMAI